MCENCMTYNHPDTIYYKEAKKLQTIGMRATSKVSIYLDTSLSCDTIL